MGAIVLMRCGYQKFAHLPTTTRLPRELRPALASAAAAFRRRAHVEHFELADLPRASARADQLAERGEDRPFVAFARWKAIEEIENRHLDRFDRRSRHDRKQISPRRDLGEP